MNNKKKIISLVTRILISAVVILLIIFGAGIGYTWYMGRDMAVADDSQPEEINNNYSPITPVRLAENVPESVSVQSLTTPIQPGSNASMSIKTKPDSKCKISVIRDKVEMLDSGLVEKIANEYGTVSWSWSVGENTLVGKWPITVTCYYGEQWAVGTGDLEISYDAEKL